MRPFRSLTSRQQFYLFDKPNFRIRINPKIAQKSKISKKIHDKTDPIGAPECGYDDCGMDQHGDQEFLLGGLRACFTWTQIDVQNDQDIQGQINAPVPDMAVGNYCAKLADDKKEQKKIFEIVF